MRGLESLIPQKKSEYSEDLSSKESIFLIDIDKIKPNPYQPRREFNKIELEELAESIKTYGILQPLLVSKVEREVPNGRQVDYELIAGERRLRAAKLAKQPRVPVIIKHAPSNKHKLEVSLIENIQRNDLSPLEEAAAYKRLQQEFGVSQSDIARRVSKSRPYVANTIRMLSLPQKIQGALARGEINEGHTRPLLSLEAGNLQDKLFSEITTQRFTVRQAEERARQLAGETSVKKIGAFAGGKAKVDPELLKLVDQFKNTYNISRVHVKTDGRKANFAVSFGSKKELSEWIRRLIS